MKVKPTLKFGIALNNNKEKFEGVVFSKSKRELKVQISSLQKAGLKPFGKIFRGYL